MYTHWHNNNKIFLNKMNKNTHFNKPLIFTKKVNDDYKVIPLKKSTIISGFSRHFPPATREWFNSIYTYNTNTIKNLSIADKTLNNLIRSYFNLYFNDTLLESSYLATRFRRLSLTKIFFSRAELKHTNSKVIITLYVYNEEKRFLLFELRQLINTLLVKRVYDKGEIKSLSLIDFFKLYLDLKKQLPLATYIKELDYSTLTDAEQTKPSLSIKSSESNLDSEYMPMYKEYDRIYKEVLRYAAFEDIIEELSYFKILLNLNKSKFENNFLYKLNLLTNKIYNKEIEFNIINLKSVIFNSDIFTEAISMKLKDRNNSLLKVLKSSLTMYNLPNYKSRDNYKKIVLRNLLINKGNKLHINSAIGIYNYDTLNGLILDLFSNKTISNNSKFIKKDKLTDKTVQSLVLNSLKHKNIGGIRLEAKGRLTKRFTASRSLFKMKWKGSLKNIDASFRGWSSIILRGNLKSNLQYSVVNSKTRNGAFGLKGWISGR